MSKFMLTLLVALSLALVSTSSVFAWRQSDKVTPGKGTPHQYQTQSQAKADADFDAGHANGYLFTYDYYPDTGDYIVTWYKK